MIKLIALIILSLGFYVITLIAYYFNNNFFKSEEDLRKFVIGPFIIFFVYGLLRSKVIGSNEELQHVTLFNGGMLAAMFIWYFGITKILSNHILSVDNKLVGPQFENNNNNYM